MGVSAAMYMPCHVWFSQLLVATPSRPVLTPCMIPEPSHSRPPAPARPEFSEIWSTTRRPTPAPARLPSRRVGGRAWSLNTLVDIQRHLWAPAALPLGFEKNLDAVEVIRLAITHPRPLEVRQVLQHFIVKCKQCK